MIRKLATIQRVEKIEPIEGADAIELVKIMGWQCVTQKGGFKEGDKGVYFEVDSYLPIDERFEFLRKSCYRNNEYVGEGFRIRTLRLRGELSQGLFLPISLIPEAEGLDLGADVTDLLGVKKWDVPETLGDMGIIIGDKPHGIPTTDELRVQSAEVLLEKMLGKAYYIATKQDGTSCTVYCKEGVVGVCGRSDEYKEDTETSSMWRFVKETKLDEKLKSYGRDIVLQGEYCGHGIQKNKLRLKKPELFVFNAIDMSSGMKRLGLEETKRVVGDLGVSMVPIEEEGRNFNYTMEEILERARGKYPSGVIKEGIVVRPVEPEYVQEVGCYLSFKAINNDYLLKED